MSGPRTDFGAATPWVLDRVKAAVKDGLKIGGKNYAVEFILKDNQSDANQTNVVAKELILGEKCDLVLSDDGENIAGAADELADARGVPLLSTLSPWEAWFFGRHGSPDKGFPFTFHYCIGAGDVFNLYAAMWNTVKTNKTVGTFFGFARGTRFCRSATRPAAGAQEERLQRRRHRLLPVDQRRLLQPDHDDEEWWRQHPQRHLLSEPFRHVLESGGAGRLQAGSRHRRRTVPVPGRVEALGDRGDGMSTEVLWNPHLPYHSSLTGQSAQELADEYEKSTGKQWTAPLGISHSLFEVGLGALKAAAEPKNNKSVRDSLATLNIDTDPWSAVFRQVADQKRGGAAADRRPMAQDEIRQVQIRVLDRQ